MTKLFREIASILNRLLSVLVLAGVTATVSAQETPGSIDKRFDKPPEPLSRSKPLLVPLQDQPQPAEAATTHFTLRV